MALIARARRRGRRGARPAAARARARRARRGSSPTATAWRRRTSRRCSRALLAAGARTSTGAPRLSVAARRSACASSAARPRAHAAPRWRCPTATRSRTRSPRSQAAGIRVDGYDDGNVVRRPRIDVEGVDVKVIRPQDMPQQVALGQFDLAITGRDWLFDHLVQFPSSPVEEVVDLRPLALQPRRHREGRRRPIRSRARVREWRRAVGRADPRRQRVPEHRRPLRARAAPRPLQRDPDRRRVGGLRAGGRRDPDRRHRDGIERAREQADGAGALLRVDELRHREQAAAGGRAARRLRRAASSGCARARPSPSPRAGEREPCRARPAHDRRARPRRRAGVAPRSTPIAARTTSARRRRTSACSRAGTASARTSSTSTTSASRAACTGCSRSEPALRDAAALDAADGGVHGGLHLAPRDGRGLHLRRSTGRCSASARRCAATRWPNVMDRLLQWDVDRATASDDRRGRRDPQRARGDGRRGERRVHRAGHAASSGATCRST